MSYKTRWSGSNLTRVEIWWAQTQARNNHDYIVSIGDHTLHSLQTFKFSILIGVMAAAVSNKFTQVFDLLEFSSLT